jgi:hypothetical protein
MFHFHTLYRTSHTTMNKSTWLAGILWYYADVEAVKRKGACRFVLKTAKREFVFFVCFVLVCLDRRLAKTIRISGCRCYLPSRPNEHDHRHHRHRLHRRRHLEINNTIFLVLVILFSVA